MIRFLARNDRSEHKLEQAEKFTAEIVPRSPITKIGEQFVVCQLGTATLADWGGRNCHDFNP
jgi:hypothetical protein